MVKFNRLTGTNLEPRGLSEDHAAAYIGLCDKTFRDMVADGRMPKPIRVGRRVLWDRHAVDRAFDALLDAGDNDNKPKEWDSVL